MSSLVIVGLNGDIGHVITLNLYKHQVSAVVASLSAIEKYKLLTDHDVPPDDYVFPTARDPYMGNNGGA